MTDYSRSAFRQSGVITVAEQQNRLTEAFEAGQRDAEQKWPADASRWNFTGPLGTAYHAGYCQPHELRGRSTRDDGTVRYSL